MSSKRSDSDNEEEVVNHQFKIILLGDGAVGKTSIATRFSDDKFSQSYKQTVGVDFFIKRISLPQVNMQIAMQMWDIGGQSIGSKMITNYISGADAILMCYDITNYESFANLEDWYRLVLRTFANTKVPYVALLGNKNDLKHMTAVRFVQHSKFAEENGMSSFLMSAKNGDQVTQAFWKIASTLAGVPFNKFEQGSHTVVIPATIIDHKRHDEEVNEGKVPEFNKKSTSNCIVS